MTTRTRTRPAPTLPDLSRDPKLLLLKPFLDWLYKRVPEVQDLVTALTTRVQALEDAPPAASNPSTHLFEFWHLGCNSTTTARRMFSGTPVSSQWDAANFGNAGRRIIPYDGTLKRIIASNPVATSGGTNDVTYTVLKSTDQGTTWTPTALAVSMQASVLTSQTNDTDVAVNAGDWIIVEITYSAAVNSASGTAKTAAAAVWFEKG